MIIELLKQFLKDKLTLDDQLIDELLNEFINSLPSNFINIFGMKKCKS
jgi:hypothetical protein